jgi:lysophospholipase L1-like esterase
LQHAAGLAQADGGENLAAPVADGEKVQFLDIYGKFLEADSSVSKKYFCEGLHLNHDGYLVWREAVMDKIAEICGK